MKNFLLTLLILIAGIPNSLISQNYPSIGAFTIIPAFYGPVLVPTKFVTSTMIVNQGQHLGTSFTVTPPGSAGPGKIELRGCYYDGQILPATQTFIDTFFVGVLPVGGYTVTFKAYQSSSSSSCTPVDSNSISFFHDVPLVESINERSLGNKPNVYPNLAQNELTLLSVDKHSQKVQIRNLIGKTVIEQLLNPGQTFINLEKLLPGVYFYLVLNDENKILLSSKFVISR